MTTSLDPTLDGAQRAEERRARTRALEKEITELNAHLDAAMYRWLKLVAEVDRDRLWGGDGLASCAHWLDWKCGINIATAREKVRVARALDSLPRISEAFRKGEVSYSKVRAMSRVANAQTEERAKRRSSSTTGDLSSTTGTRTARS